MTVTASGGARRRARGVELRADRDDASEEPRGAALATSDRLAMLRGCLPRVPLPGAVVLHERQRVAMGRRERTEGAHQGPTTRDGVELRRGRRRRGLVAVLAVVVGSAGHVLHVADHAPRGHCLSRPRARVSWAFVGARPGCTPRRVDGLARAGARRLCARFRPTRREALHDVRARVRPRRCGSSWLTRRRTPCRAPAPAMTGSAAPRARARRRSPRVAHRGEAPRSPAPRARA